MGDDETRTDKKEKNGAAKEKVHGRKINDRKE
jgi:hypothetical protein